MAYSKTLDARLREHDKQEVTPAQAGIQEPYRQAQAALSDHAVLSPHLQVRRIPGQFDKRQARSPDLDLIRADSRRGRKPLTSFKGDVVILVDTIPADPHASHQLSVFVQRHATSKDLGAILDARDIARTTFWLTRRG